MCSLWTENKGMFAYLWIDYKPKMKSANFLQQIWTYLQFCKAQSRLLHGYFPILFEEKV